MNMLDSLVGPLNKKYCYYFYILAVMFLLSFIVSICVCFSRLFKKNNIILKLSNCVLLSINSLTLYFVNRLMFNMCVNSL